VVYLRQGSVDLEAAGFLQLPTAVGAVIGAVFGRVLSDKVVGLLFAAFLILSAVRLAAVREPADARRANEARRSAWITAIVSCLGAGLVSSALGVGGGIVFVPVLAVLLGLPTKNAAATSTYLIGLTGAASALIYLQDYKESGSVRELLRIAIPSVVGILIGARIGALSSKHINAGQLKAAFVLVMLVNAGLLGWKYLHG
jgi:uncharacterized membrane protein YfcA